MTLHRANDCPIGRMLARQSPNTNRGLRICDGGIPDARICEAHSRASAARLHGQRAFLRIALLPLLEVPDYVVRDEGVEGQIGAPLVARFLCAGSSEKKRTQRR